MRAMKLKVVEASVFSLLLCFSFFFGTATIERYGKARRRLANKATSSWTSKFAFRVWQRNYAVEIWRLSVTGLIAARLNLEPFSANFRCGYFWKTAGWWISWKLEGRQGRMCSRNRVESSHRKIFDRLRASESETALRETFESRSSCRSFVNNEAAT